MCFFLERDLQKNEKLCLWNKINGGIDFIDSVKFDGRIYLGNKIYSLKMLWFHC